MEGTLICNACSHKRKWVYKNSAYTSSVRPILEYRSDWLISLCTEPNSPDSPKTYIRAICAPYRNQGSPVALLKLQMAPRLILLTSYGSNNKEPRYLCLSEVKVSHSQRMWAEVSSLTHTSYTVGCLAAPTSRDVFSGRSTLYTLWSI